MSTTTAFLTSSGGTYTYSTPDGWQRSFNSSGLQTRLQCPDGNEHFEYGYSGIVLESFRAIDGSLTTITSGGFETEGVRSVELTISSDDLTAIANPDGGTRSLTYDGHRSFHDFSGLTVRFSTRLPLFLDRGSSAQLHLQNSLVSLGAGMPPLRRATCPVVRV